MVGTAAGTSRINGMTSISSNSIVVALPAPLAMALVVPIFTVFLAFLVALVLVVPVVLPVAPVLQTASATVALAVLVVY